MFREMLSTTALPFRRMTCGCGLNEPDLLEPLEGMLPKLIENAQKAMSE